MARKSAQGEQLSEFMCKHAEKENGLHDKLDRTTSEGLQACHQDAWSHAKRGIRARADGQDSHGQDVLQPYPSRNTDG